MFPRFWRGWVLQQIQLEFLSLLQFLSICEDAISQPKGKMRSKFDFGIWVGRTSTSGLGVICLSSASRLRTTNFSSPFYSVSLLQVEVEYRSLNQALDILKNFDEATVKLI